MVRQTGVYEMRFSYKEEKRLKKIKERKEVLSSIKEVRPLLMKRCFKCSDKIRDERMWKATAYDRFWDEKLTFFLCEECIPTYEKFIEYLEDRGYISKEVE
jgi:DNA-directed RNA polymerase subunit M/transcription elongation factor TFIIS